LKMGTDEGRRSPKSNAGIDEIAGTAWQGQQSQLSNRWPGSQGRRIQAHEMWQADAAENEGMRATGPVEVAPETGATRMTNVADRLSAGTNELARAQRGAPAARSARL